MATRSKLLQPRLRRLTPPLRKTTPVGRIGYRHHTLVATQAMVPTAPQHGHRDHPLPRHTRPFLPWTARLARGGRTTRVERGGLSTATPASLHTRRGAVGRTLRTTSPKFVDLRSLTYRPPVRPRPARYQLRKPEAQAQ
jgi:hypothetical protein